MKHRMWIIGIAVALVASVIGVGFAAAQGGRGMSPGTDMDFGRFGDTTMLTTIAEQLDMTITDLVTELQGGKTVAQVAEEKGVALDTIISAITTQYSEQLAARVEAGELTQAQADARIALETANLSAEFANTLSFGHGMDYGYIGQTSPMLAAVAGALGMDVADVETELQAGKTVAQLAEEKGVELDTVVAAVTAMHTAEITARVAAGELTQEQADAMLALDTANITAMLSGAMPLGMDFGGRDGFNGPMGGRGSNGSMGGRDNFRGGQPGGRGGYSSPTTPSATPEATAEANT